MSEEIKLSSIHTPCKECAFAKYENITQIDCELGLISKYRNTDAQIIEAYDEDKEYYIINNRKCIGYRKDSWFKQFSENSLSLAQKKEKVLATFKLNYILFIDLKNINLSTLEKIIHSAKTFDIPPAKIILLRHNSSAEIFEYNFIQNLLKKSEIHCPWRLQTMLDDDVSLRSTLSNTVSNNPKHKFVFYVSDFSENMNTILNIANKMVFDDLSSFIVLTDKDEKSKLFLGLMYRYAWYSSGIDIINDTNSLTFIP